MFKSIDGGATWTFSSNGLPDVFVRALAIDPVTTSTIYAGTSGAFIGPVFSGMFKSINGGLSWTPLASTPAPGSVTSVAIDPQNPAIVYVGTTGSLFRSTNGGTTWAVMNAGLPNGIVNALAVDPQTSSTVYAGTQFGLYKSTNNGTSWTAMNTGFTPSPNPSILALVIDPETPSTVYAGTGGFGVFKSIDGAANWTRTSTGISSGLINALAMDPGQPNVLYAATSSSGVFTTINGGANWTPLNTGLTTLTTEALAISNTGTCLHTGTNNAGATGRVFDFALVADCGPPLVVEYYHQAFDHYFITWVPDEIAKLDAGIVIKGWTRTGQSFRTYTTARAGTSPVCRFYIPPALGDSHFFGRGTTECVATGQKNPSFVLEDPAFMQMFLPVEGICPANTTQVYRVFSNRPDANHRYMTDKTIRAQMTASGWLAEGDGPDFVVMCAPQ